IKKCQKDSSKIVEKPSLEMSKGHGNNTNINNTDYSDTNLILSSGENNKDGLEDDEIDIADKFRKIIHRNIEYEHHKRYGNYSIESIDNIVELMVDVCILEKGSVPINGNLVPVSLVKNRFLKLNSSHIEYIMNSLDENPSNISNIRNYLLTTIYNAVNT